MNMIRASVLMIILLFPGIAWSGEADVVDATATRTENGRYTFHATIRHADTGWKHYADKWDVVAPDGKVLATRVLYHPHVDEQPFTRSLSGVTIPPGITTVTIQAHDSVHKYGSKTVAVALPGRQ